jgi:hypothetical protein
MSLASSARSSRLWHRLTSLARGLVRRWAVEPEVDSLRERLAARTHELQAAWDHAHKLDAALQDLDRWRRSPVYHQDSLAVWSQDVSFLGDRRFVQAYARGMSSGHLIGVRQGVPGDLHIEWRVWVCCWAATQASRLPGSFVECGVNTGILSLAVCDYVDFNGLDKDFYLFDTYCGIPGQQVSDEEKGLGIDRNMVLYEECYDLACRNFAPFPRARLVRGTLPDSLSRVAIDEVAYLSIDLNVAAPEAAVLEFFWDRLVPSGIVVLDDYGWLKHAVQKRAHDAFAARKGVTVLQLPTGQGLLVKPGPA